MSAPVLAMDQGEFTETVSDALKRHFGDDRAAVKKLAAAANTNARTAENWLRGNNTPDALHFLRLMATIPALQAEVRRLAGMESDIDPEFARDLAAAFATFQRLSAK